MLWIQAEVAAAALPEVTRELSTPNVIADLSSSLDCAGVAATAVIWSFLTRYNQKMVLLSSLGLVAVFAFGGAVAPSIVVLLIMRFLSSAAAAGIIVVGVDIVDKLWPIHRKGLAIGLFFIGPQACPALGPVVGGLLTTRWGWRSLQYFQASWSVLMLILVFVFLPSPPDQLAGSRTGLEEQMPTLKGGVRSFGQPKKFIQHLFVSELEQQVCSIGRLLIVSRSTAKALLGSFRVFVLVQHRFIALLLYIAGFSFAESSCFLVAIQSMYSADPYTYSSLLISLMYLPYAVGCIMASVGGGKWSDRVMRSTAARRTARKRASVESVESEQHVAQYLPEDRLGMNAWIPVACLPVALTIFGWVISQQPAWFFPLIPSVMMGLSSGMILGLATTILVELIPAQAASLMALNSIGRNAFAAVGGSVAQPLMDIIGPVWLFGGLGVIALLNIGILCWMNASAGRWREKIWELSANCK